MKRDTKILFLIMNNIKIKVVIFTYLIYVLLLDSNAVPQSIGFQSRPAGYLFSGQLTFDIYKPYCSVCLNLKRHERPTVIQSGGEVDIYSKLGKQLYLPKFILFQATLYPLSALSTYLESDRSYIYNKFNTYWGLNIIRSIGSGYEEPYAFSLFLGNIVLLSYAADKGNKPKLQKQSGSAFAGFLVSTGNHQICDNIYLTDQWYQFELMLIGELKEKNIRKMSWNFRIGIKYHKNKIFRDVFVFAIERNHSIWQNTGFLLLKNSIFKYKAYVPTSVSDNPPLLVYHCFSYGKKIPVKLFNKKIFLILAGGIRWEWIYRYDSNLNDFESKPAGNLVWLFQPNIEF